MKLEVGMYVRTRGGRIHKVTDIIPFYENDKLIYEKQYLCLNNKNSGYRICQFQDYISKASHNIIDLIEVGDYVNGYKVYSGGKKHFDYILTWDEVENYYMKIPLFTVDIKTIVTKEQFESMQYKVD